MLSKFMWLVRKAITFIHKNRRKKRRILCDTKYVGQFEAREGLTFSISCCFPFSLAAWLPIKLTLRDGQASAGIGFQFLISYMQQFWRQGDITKCQSQQQTKRTSVTKRVRGDNVMDASMTSMFYTPVIILSNSTSGNDFPIFNENSSDDQFLLQSHSENYWTLLTCKSCTHFL